MTDVISSYTREDALEDGQLVDVSKMAAEAGFRLPVAVTVGVWSDISKGIEEGTAPAGQSIEGRQWDVLHMAMLAARSNSTESMIKFKVIIGRTTHTYWGIISGEGQGGSAVLTIMRPEDY